MLSSEEQRLKTCLATMFVKRACYKSWTAFFMLGHPEVHHREPQRGPWEGQHLCEGGSQVSGFDSADNWCDINCFSWSPDNETVMLGFFSELPLFQKSPLPTDLLYFVTSPIFGPGPEQDPTVWYLWDVWSGFVFPIPNVWNSHWPTWYSTYNASSKDLL